MAATSRIVKHSGAGEMTLDRRRPLAGIYSGILAGCLGCLLLLAGSTRGLPWWRYDVDSGTLVMLSEASLACTASSTDPTLSTLELPESWQITDYALADVTGDGLAEWVLLVWRPWQDWPIQAWVPVPSPISEFQDRRGDSCHVILMEPETGDILWAGSALPRPMLALDVGDVDGDGVGELVTLEGDYAGGREGQASRVNVWAWNGFGFSLASRSPEGAFARLCLTDPGNGGILVVVVR